MRILVCGDSITHGMWSERGGWVQILRSEFDAKFIADTSKDQPDLYNLGISANNSADVATRIEQEIAARKRPGLAVVVAIATNDASDSWVHVELTDFRENLQKIIVSARKFTDKLLFVGLPPVDEARTNPWFVDEAVSYTNEKLRAYEQAAQEICRGERIPFAPVFEAFAHEQAKHDLLPDGLHPNDAGHELIANLVRPELDKLLKA